MSHDNALLRTQRSPTTWVLCVRTSCQNPTKGGINRTSRTLVSFGRGLLELVVSEALCTQTGLQAREVGASRRHFSAKDTSRIPLNTVISFVPSELF
eukprot:4548-Amphidinium_carterae.1